MTNSLPTWKWLIFWLICRLKMVMFHRFLYVYQRVHHKKNEKKNMTPPGLRRVGSCFPIQFVAFLFFTACISQFEYTLQLILRWTLYMFWSVWPTATWVIKCPHWTSPNHWIPLGIWSIMATIRWCPIYPSHGTFNNPSATQRQLPELLLEKALHTIHGAGSRQMRRAREGGRGKRVMSRHVLRK